MTNLVVVPVFSVPDVELARRPVAGKPWLGRLVDQLSTARSVSRVVVVSGTRTANVTRWLDAQKATIVTGDDPIAIAHDLQGSHDGVVFCPLAQMFADPARLDTLAARPRPAGTARMVAVLACEPTLPLTGGVFLEIVTRDGLRALIDGADLASLPTATWATWPEPPELRVEIHGDIEWAIRTYDELLTCEGEGRLEAAEAVLAERRSSRFVWWDQMGPQPRSILTIRCLRGPLFERFVRYAQRLATAPIDVVCHASLATETAALAGVRRVIPFEAERFSLEALSPSAFDAIREAGYDLCVIPVLEPTLRGFSNVAPLATASHAGLAIWVDIFGRRDVLAGSPPHWDSTVSAHPAPYEHVGVYQQRAIRAFEAFTNNSQAPTAKPLGLESSQTRPSDTRGLPPELLTRLDENLSSRRLIDNPDLGIDLSGRLLSTLPAAREIVRTLAELESRGTPWAPPLATIVDLAFEHFVQTEAVRGSAAADVAATAHTVQTIERLSRAVSSLAHGEKQRLSVTTPALGETRT